MTAMASILVVGAGPTGLTLALQAHAHGASVRIVDRRPDAIRPSRALIMHPRTLEVLRPLGITEAILARADTAPEACLHLGHRTVRARLDALPMPDTAFPHLTLVRQMDVERVLLDALADRGVPVERGVELIDVVESAGEAVATLRTPAGAEARGFDYVAGCDGQESAVRRLAAIGWGGGPYRVEVLLADVALEPGLDDGIAHAVAGRRGLLFLFPLGERAPWRLLATRPAEEDALTYGQPGPAVPLDELQALIDGAGLDARIAQLAWSARYQVQHRLADRFRAGRLFIAGDAAHAWSPATGQGMNTGIQDAANLGWKLALALRATEPEALLASYGLERRPAARRLLAVTHFTFWAEAATGPLPALLRGVVAPLGAPAIPFLLDRRRLIAEGIALMSQLRAPYRGSTLSMEGKPRASGRPRAGERLPDTTVTIDGQEIRLHALIATPGVHVLLHRDAAPIERIGLGDHVTAHRLQSEPGTGLVAVRPDGYVGFRGDVAEIAQLRAWLARAGAGAGPDRR
jgi:2-polyprenyl-6-methoxyphenol hydroxylase-like FAD-dependent oxidoreductase